MNSRGGIHVQRRLLGRFAAVALVGLTAVACTAAIPNANSSSVGTTASAVESPSPSASAMPSVASTPSATATPTQSPSASPSPTTGVLPSLGPVPSGDWTAVRWVAVPGGLAAAATVVPSGDLVVSDGRFGVYGWSRGYVGFNYTTNVSDWSAIEASYSADGLHWKTSGPLDMTGLKGPYDVTSVVEGPAGLLAVGRLQAAACSTRPGVDVMWRSSDGIAWRRADMSTFGGGSVAGIEAGSAGYIATGSLKAADVVWTSTDGVTWSSVDLASKTFKGMLVQNATAFSGGYVIAGSVRSPDYGCGSQPYLTPSLWFSPDGRAWSRDKVPGVKAGDPAWMKVGRISDTALLATEWSQTGDITTTSTWTSTDGRAWNPVSVPALDNSTLITNGRHGLIVNTPQAGQIDVYAFEHDLSLAKLVETGNVPDQQAWADPGMWPPIAFGPTGLIVANASGNVWVGVFVAG